MQQVLVTGAAALLFAATFIFGDRVRPMRALFRDERSAISFSAGVPTAYVFVHVMPELHDARRALAESVSLRYEGMSIYFVALVGFLVFYGLDHLRKRLRDPAAPEDVGTGFKFHIGGFAVYVALMAYLLVHNLEDSTTSIALYAVAVAIHFLGMDHALREDHGEAYDRIGRFVLAAMCLLGWAVGQLVALPHHVLALLVAFVAGAIIINSLMTELPSDKDGRVLPFIAGGLIYGLILLPLG